MKAIHLGILLAFPFTVNFDSRAAERLAQLRVNDDIYSEVTITSVTATDIFFTHAKGMGNAKLKNLSPELQKRFGYRSDQAAAAGRLALGDVVGDGAGAFQVAQFAGGLVRRQQRFAGMHIGVLAAIA